MIKSLTLWIDLMSYIPLMNKYVSPKRFSEPWITPRLLELIKLKSLYIKLYRRGIVSHNFNKSFKNKLNSLIDKSKRSYYIYAINAYRGDMARTWKLIKNEINFGEPNKSIKALYLSVIQRLRTKILGQKNLMFIFRV